MVESGEHPEVSRLFLVGEDRLGLRSPRYTIPNRFERFLQELELELQSTTVAEAHRA